MENHAWYQYYWFKTSTWKGFEWENPWAFWLMTLLALLMILHYVMQVLSKEKLASSLSNQTLSSDPVTWLRFLPPLFFTLFLSLLIVALARPQKTNERVERWTEGVDIVLTLDISRSMEIEDFRPNRMEAAKRLATDFVGGRQEDRVALVIFAGEAYSLAPLTTDIDLVMSYIQDIDFNQITMSGTAIGSALAVSVNRLRESEAKSKVIVLMSDGDNNAGNIDPATAADLAKSFGIKVHTIAIGREGKVPMGKDYFGRTRYMENTLDETTLRNIAKVTGGNFYRANDEKALEQIFDTIDELEKTEIIENRFRETVDYYFIYLRWALVFLLLWLLFKSSFVANVLKD